MIAAPAIDLDCPLATDGDIAVINLESARLQSWSRFWQAPEPEGIAEYIVEQEQMTLQFLSDTSALGRLDDLVQQLVRQGVDAARTSLIRAQVASTTHRFAEAREHLKAIEIHGPLPEAATRLLLSIDQACGNRLDEVLETRRRMAAESGRLEDLVPLGALFADIREFDEADCNYQRALREYQDVSPFALAWVCFQLGSLWGELVTERQPDRAAHWYQKAIEYVPSYVKAKVHLSEIYLSYGRAEDAETLLVSSVSSGDPEVHWRLADIMVAKGNFSDAKAQMQAARSGFEALLETHLLAFADHGAEFYSGSGNDVVRAFELARVNVENRPTLRAFEQAYETAIEAAKLDAATEIFTAAKNRWGGTPAFKVSPLAGRLEQLR
jgi:tetratricopeptide (TPR) repeat protein